MMLTLGCDPGESTGLALFRDDELLWSKTVTNGVDGFIEWAKTDMPWHNVLILESFIAEKDFVGRSFASEVIGAALAISQAQQKVFQSRGQKATLIRGSEKDRFQWLRNHGFTGTSHELDAITHALLRLRSTGNEAAIKRYWV